LLILLDLAGHAVKLGVQPWGLERMFGLAAATWRLMLVMLPLIGMPDMARSQPPAQPAKETWVIACDSFFPPYNWLDQGKVTGMDAEIVTALVRRAGAEPRFEPAPWNRVQQLLELGQIDAAFQFVGRPDRFEKFHMIGPIRHGETVFAVPRDGMPDWDTLEDFKPFSIGVVQGYTYGAAFDQATYLRKESTAGDNRLLLRMLAAKRVDAVIGDRVTLAYLAQQEGLRDSIRFLTKPFDRVARYIAVPKAKAAIAERLQRALDAMNSDGSITRIMLNWE